MQAMPTQPDAQDATQLACIVTALIAVLVSFFALVLGAGWLLGLVAIPLLAALPSLSIMPDSEFVAQIVLPLVGLVAHDVALQRRGRSGTGMLIALGCAGLSLAIALPLAQSQLGRLSALPQAAIDGIVATSDNIRANGLPFGQPHASGAADKSAQVSPSNKMAGQSSQVDSPAPAGKQDAIRPDVTSTDASLPAGGVVSRNDLVQTGQPLFDVTLDRRPDAALYLLAFTGASYADGRWAPADEHDFVQTEAAAWGADEDDVADSLARLPYERALALLGSNKPVRITISARSVQLSASDLTPYACVTVSQAAGSAELDSLGAVATGNSSQPTGPASAITYETPLLGAYADLNDADLIGEGSVALSDDMQTSLLADYAAWIPEAYLGVDREALPRLAQLVADTPREGLAAVTDTILQTLADNVAYTTTSGTFPADVDIAEYLLFDGHLGYCQHFATAATLMYRLYGIPARYVSGFALPATAFSQHEDGTWRAVASDMRAHAWVEIYTDALGWVPVEVTPPNGAEQAAPFVAEPSDTADSGTANTPTTAEPENSEPPSSYAEHAVADLDKDGVDSPDSERNVPQDDGRPALSGVVIGIVAGVAVLAVTGVFGSRALVIRRQRVIAARNQAPANVLLADALDALNYASVLVNVSGTEPDVVQRLAHAVPGLVAEDAAHLVAQAQHCAFGPSNAQPISADAHCHAVYDQICAHAYAVLPRIRRLAFLYVRAWS